MGWGVASEPAAPISVVPLALLLRRTPTVRGAFNEGGACDEGGLASCGIGGLKYFRGDRRYDTMLAPRAGTRTLPGAAGGV